MRFTQFRCKRCGSDEGYRSRPRTFMEKHFLRLVLLQPVRCGHCFKRSYQSKFVRVRPGRARPGNDTQSPKHAAA
jgi:predicted nucleic-acid-binding Zn-ribbon protein